jgi:hypothetical protein
VEVNFFFYKKNYPGGKFSQGGNFLYFLIGRFARGEILPVGKFWQGGNMKIRAYAQK